jgi:hypothetical protein
VRKQDIRPLSMSVDEALKYVISLGMVAPDKILSKVLPEAIATNNMDFFKYNNQL